MRLCVILPNQLSFDLPSLKAIDKQSDIVLIAEAHSEFTHVKHHQKKIVFLVSAMRHFAQALQKKGYTVKHIPLTQNVPSVSDAINTTLKDTTTEEIVVTYPSDYRMLLEMQSWEKTHSRPVNILHDNQFLCSTEEFNEWAAGKKQLRMEMFYRKMRIKHQILMEGKDPAGGQWNYDADNRKAMPKDLDIPKTYQHKPDAITQQVMGEVTQLFGDHFGDIEPFHFATTHIQAKQALEQFITERLPLFGAYQDAMVQDEPWLFHAHIGLYINAGLLTPMACIKAACDAYENGSAPLNSVEGFVRQILGWREYIRGIYWLKMPAYKTLNFLDAQQPLPDFYWTGDTQMNCLKQCVTETKQNAYAHHIQRLMVLGNFALLAGIKPEAINEWYLIVYADAYEWVELPNVSGMVLFADGGYLASKPYASGGNYINKMSNYCKSCFYDVKEKTGDKACPFNYLYWDFLARNKDKLEDNARIALVYRTYNKLSDERKKQISKDAKNLIQNIQI